MARETLMPTAEDFALALIGAAGPHHALEAEEMHLGLTHTPKLWELWRVLAGVALVDRGFDDRAVRASLGLMDKARPSLAMITKAARYDRVCAAWDRLKDAGRGDGRMAHVYEGVAG